MSYLGIQGSLVKFGIFIWSLAVINTLPDISFIVNPIQQNLGLSSVTMMYSCNCWMERLWSPYNWSAVALKIIWKYVFFVIHDTKYSLYEKHYPKFRWKFPEMFVPRGKTIYKYVKRFWTAGFILDSKRTCRRPFKLWKSLGEIGVRLEISKKSLAWLGLNGCNITKLLHLHLCKMTDWQTQRCRSWSKTAFCELVTSGGVGWRNWPHTLFVWCWSWFWPQWIHISVWSAENTVVIHKMALHVGKVHIWCAMSISGIIAPIFVFWGQEFILACNTFWHHF